MSPPVIGGDIIDSFIRGYKFPYREKFVSSDPCYVE